MAAKMEREDIILLVNCKWPTMCDAGSPLHWLSYKLTSLGCCNWWRDFNTFIRDEFVPNRTNGVQSATLLHSQTQWSTHTSRHTYKRTHTHTHIDTHIVLTANFQQSWVSKFFLEMGVSVQSFTGWMPFLICYYYYYYYYYYKCIN